MRVIARIPELATTPDAAAARAATAPAAPGPVRRPPCRGRAPGGLGITWPVAVLAILAVVSWVLASRNEHARLHRQRDEARIAREPAAAPVDSSAAPSAGGAVVR